MACLVLILTLSATASGLLRPATRPTLKHARCRPLTRLTLKHARCGPLRCKSPEGDLPPSPPPISAYDISRELSKYDSMGLRFRTAGPSRRISDSIVRIYRKITSTGSLVGSSIARLPAHGSAAALTLLAYGAQSYAPRAAMLAGCRMNGAINHGQWHRLVSSVFLHGGFAHLLSNLFSLWRIGPIVEASFGPARTWLIYLLSGLGGNLAGLAWGEPRSMSVGASGAVFGMIGATGGFVFRNKRALGSYGDALLSNAGQVLLINLFIGTRRGSGIDNLAHLGGFASGALVGLLVAPAVGTATRSVGVDASDSSLLPSWLIRALLAATAVLYVVGLNEATRMALAVLRVYGRR